MKHRSIAICSAVIVATLGCLSQAAVAVLPSVELDKTATTTAIPLSPITASAGSNASQIQTRLTAGIVSVDAQGKETLAPLTAQTQLTSGNVVEYHGYVINGSPDRVRKMKVTFAIPANMELVAGSVAPEPVYGSNDGQTFNYMPIKANINGVLQNMPMSYYKTLQWDVAGLGLNEVAEVKYRAKVK